MRYLWDKRNNRSVIARSIATKQSRHDTGDTCEIATLPSVARNDINVTQLSTFAIGCSRFVAATLFFLIALVGFAGNVAIAVTPCNDDRACSGAEICQDGVCKSDEGKPCNDDRGCLVGRNLQCKGGKCTAPPSCTQDSQCGAGTLCISRQCLTGFCRNNTQCGDRQVCGSDSRCRTVPCTTASHCAADQTCNPTTNLCVARCPSGQAFVRSNTKPVCSACVDPRAPHFRPTATGGCPLGLIPADGFCIADCRPKPVTTPGPKDPAGIGIIPGRLGPQPAPGTR